MANCRKKMLRRTILLIVVSCLFGPVLGEEGEPSVGERRPLVLVHYMPWFQAKPFSDEWGWHWSMNHFQPDRTIDADSGRREIASHFYPLIGPYDSGDHTVLEYHLLLMKLAGIDGVIVDWYGLTDFRDYRNLHTNTKKLVQLLEEFQLKFAVCYEDQTISELVKHGRIPADHRVRHAAREINWLASNWFLSDSYISWRKAPVLLSFGQTGLSGLEWQQCLDRTGGKIAYFSQHHRRKAAVGSFDWPIPNEGIDAITQFDRASATWDAAIPVAFPRFVDVYEKAGVQKSFGNIDDNDGRTFSRSLELAMQSGRPWLQIATWNDWGEGTMIEPSREYNYRDLETLQELRRNHLDATFSADAEDLRMPLTIYRRRKTAVDVDKQVKLDRIVALIKTGRLHEARSLLIAATSTSQ